LIRRQRGGRDPREESTAEEGKPEVVETAAEELSKAGADDSGERSGADTEEVGSGEVAAESEEEPGAALEEEPTEEQTAAQALAELEALKDRHLRLAAEFENFRKRTSRERMELATIAQAELVRRLLPTLDDLARVAATPSETTTVEALEKGIELILRNLEKELGDAGLARVEASGARFDPEVHQALMITEVGDVELDETVSEVLMEGYRFRGRLARPAQVVVQRYAPPPAEADEDAARDTGD
jgi:molecular chaperone GrpE